MRVQFTYNQEDVVDAAMRFSARSKSTRLMRRKRTAWLALLAWLLVFAFLRFSFHGAVAGIVSALIIVLTDPLTYRYEVRKNLRKIAKERYGEENEFVCEVELLAEGLRTSAENIQGTTAWETTDEVVSTDSVDIFGRKLGVVVRNRAFSSAEERQRFIELAREYMNLAKAAAKPMK